MNEYEKHSTVELIKRISGQQSVLTIPTVYLDLLDDDIKTALFFSQVVYWSDKGKRNDGWFYKTDKEWKEELKLSEYECKKARDKLTGIGVLIVDKKKANGVPTMHYKVEWDNLSKWVLKKFDNRTESVSPNFSETKNFGEPSLKNSETHSLKIPESLTESTNIDYDKEYKRDIKSKPKGNSLFDIPSKPVTKDPMDMLAHLKGKFKHEQKIKYVLEGRLTPTALDDLDVCFYYASQHKEIVGYEIPYQKDSYMSTFRDMYSLSIEQAFSLIPSILQMFRQICEEDKRKKSEWYLKIGILTFGAPSDAARIMNKLQPKINDKYVPKEPTPNAKPTGNIVDEVF